MGISECSESYVALLTLLVLPLPHCPLGLNPDLTLKPNRTKVKQHPMKPSHEVSSGDINDYTHSKPARLFLGRILLGTKKWPGMCEC